jgi:quercetin dioxygenase-like cupin family protein
MKTSILIFKSLLLVIILTFSIGSYAQDPVKVSAKEYKKVVLDNEKVRVIQVEFAPGDVAAWHSHPNHVVYILTSGKIEITNKGEKPVISELKAGEAMYMTAVTHMAKNVGTTTIKLVITEIKPAHSKMKSAASMPKSESDK